mgnify:CR=1 FL=1|tara:strand:- start:16996 stop:19731 length:2736 start_codon:yes stop_codon:yes gene_type:complete
MNRSILVIFICLLFSCRNDQDGEKIRIGFSQCINDHPWREAMNHAMRVQASLSPEIDLTIYEAHIDLELQRAQIEEMIDKKFDVIIISPMLSDKLVPVISKAFDSGIPVVLIDRKINSEKYSAYVGADNLEVGRNAGNYIASATNSSINVVELKLGDNASPSIERSEGFHEVVDSLQNIDVIASIDYTNKIEHERILSRLFDSLKTKNQRIDYFYAFNDLLALDSWRVARKKGIEKNIKFIGVDGLNGNNGGINLVRNGILEASILYPTGGAEAIKLATALAMGKDVPKINLLTTTIIDKLNADIMKDQFDKIDEQQVEIEEKIVSIKKQEDLYYAQSNLLKISITLLIVILSLSIYSIYSIITIRKKNRQLQITNQKITVQRNQIEKIANEVKESNEAKFNFFTGISHEFKTPLTLILSSIDSLKDHFREKGNKIVHEVDLIANNSNRLLRLINNLLDFRKIEDQKFNLRASRTNIFSFSAQIFNEFKREAKKRGIQFSIKTNNENAFVYIDRNLMDKVYFNLLSNAFKFTPDNGKIEINIEDRTSENSVYISIKDNGIGIMEEELKNVFTPFFKGSNNRKNSSGIGLHLSKQFIDLHLGKIQVLSVHGTEFIIKLFKGAAHFNEDQIIPEQELEDMEEVHHSSEILDEEFFASSPIGPNSDRYSILIIEDNKDLVYFLRNKLKVEYDIIVSDGTDAIEKAFEFIPDIILCDVDLPQKSGFEICSLLKNDLRTSHIPTIILTSLNDKESYLKGLESKTDLYLTKPFNYNILSQSIKSLLYNREKLRYYYTNNIFKITTGSFGNLEQDFIGKLNSKIKENIDNAEFSVENLAEDLNISRVQLYRKVKAMLGVSISDYMNTFKLENAKLMLETSDMNISEIAYANGFSSPNYFSTAFKNKYGISPIAYKRSL